MSEDDPKHPDRARPDQIMPGQIMPGQIILGWWAHNIGDRDMAHARGLAARLRRGSALDVLGEAAVHDLSRALKLRDAAVLVRLVQVLAELRAHTSQPLAAILGAGETPALSTLRFQRLMRVADADLTEALRRAIVMTDRCCNVAALGQDLLLWSEKTRSRWCFQYFGAAAPDALQGGADVKDKEISQ